MAVAKSTQVQNPDTQRRILEAAIACVKRWGIDKVTLNDIAQEAGVTRPTVYSYYSSRDEVVRYALLQSAYGFTDALLKHLGKYATPQEKIIEATLFCLKRLPSEPALALLQESGMARIMNSYALKVPEGTQIRRALFRSILGDTKIDDDELDEMVEVATRFMLSLLTLESPKKRSDKEMRAFLQRRLLPALGLAK